MATFDKILFTYAGLLACKKNQMGRSLKFTRIVLGDGRITSDQEPLESLPAEDQYYRLTQVVSPVVSVEANQCVILDTGQVSVSGPFTNADIPKALKYREIGLYALDPDVGEVLYCYGNSGDRVEDIQPITTSVTAIIKKIEIIANVGNAKYVSVNLSSNIYVSEEDMLDVTGNLSGLATSKKDSLVEAINEVDAHADEALAHIANDDIHVTAVEKIEWSDKETKAGAASKVNAHANRLDIHVSPERAAYWDGKMDPGALGSLSDLTTDDKSSLIAAINEVVARTRIPRTMTYQTYKSGGASEYTSSSSYVTATNYNLTVPASDITYKSDILITVSLSVSVYGTGSTDQQMANDVCAAIYSSATTFDASTQIAAPSTTTGIYNTDFTHSSHYVYSSVALSYLVKGHPAGTPLSVRIKHRRLYGSRSILYGGTVSAVVMPQ